MSDIMPFTFISSLVCWADAGKDAYLFGKSIINKGFLIVLCFASIRIKQG